MKKTIGIIFYILLIIILLVTTGVGIFYYINSFKINDLKDYTLDENELIITNYSEFPVEYSEITKTKYETATIVYDLDSYVIFSVEEIHVNVLDYVSKGMLIGYNNSSEPVNSSIVGLVLNVEFDDTRNMYNVTVLNYYSVSFVINLTDEDIYRINLTDNFDVLINQKNFNLAVSGINFDAISSNLTVKLQFTDNNDLSDLLLYSNSIILVKISESKTMCYNVSSTIASKVELIEDMQYKTFVKLANGEFKHINIMCQMIGDSRIGIIFDFDFPKDISSICILEK